METKTFLEAVLGDTGFYCVFAGRLSDERKVQKFYSSLDEVIHAAHNLDNTPSMSKSGTCSKLAQHQIASY